MDDSSFLRPNFATLN